MTTAAQEAFLRGFHAAYPAVTSRTLGGGRSDDDRSGYEILRDRVAGATRVLDLGCGDGHLLELLATATATATATVIDTTSASASAAASAHAPAPSTASAHAPAPTRRLAGADLSRADLALARRRPALAGAVLVECRAQELPFADGSFDACVSHMALMLMGDIERVVAELARVLAPGATLAVAVGGGAAGGEAYELFVDLVRRRLAAEPGGGTIPALGDRKARSREGLDGLLTPAGFTPVDWETVRIDLSAPLDEVWDRLSGTYDLGPLGPADRAALRAAFHTAAARITAPDGITPCAMNLRVATARRTGRQAP
ncbi:class I SAM-dependent methyltransferase [Streptomyces sp. NPDC050560]|uniref:class I SAM-dependent methyltransferase n=1 Tax=Streptomyces sp. NPDC050560 TaxID=3365630 RepID=UPI00379DD7C9